MGRSSSGCSRTYASSRCFFPLPAVATVSNIRSFGKDIDGTAINTEVGGAPSFFDSGKRDSELSGYILVCQPAKRFGQKALLAAGEIKRRRTVDEE